MLQRARAVRHPASLAALEDVSTALARQDDVVEFAGNLVARAARDDRLGRLALVFSFVSHLVDVPPPDGERQDGVDFLLWLAGEAEGPVLILAALLKALGERTGFERAAGATFVRVEVGLEEVGRLPPWADLLHSRGRYFVPLVPSRARAPLGRLPATLRSALRPAR